MSLIQACPLREVLLRGSWKLVVSDACKVAISATLIIQTAIEAHGER